MSQKSFKKFKFTTKLIPVYEAVIGIIGSRGYNVTIPFQTPNYDIARGVTLYADSEGFVGVKYMYDEYESFTRIDKLLIYLTSINTDQPQVVRRPDYKALVEDMPRVG